MLIRQTGGERVKADMAILAVGWKLVVPYLPTENLSPRNADAYARYLRSAPDYRAA